MDIFLLLFLTFLVITHCFAMVISQLGSTVRVRPGLPITLQCSVPSDGLFVMFWMTIPLNRAPVCIATVKSNVKSTVEMCEQFKKHSRINVTWAETTFALSFSTVEETDSAAYVCGTYYYGQFVFENGSMVIVEKYADALEPTTAANDSKEQNETRQTSEFLVLALAVTNVASLFLIILLCHCLKKRKSVVSGEPSGACDRNTEEVNYAALMFGHKQRRTVQKRTSGDLSVIYEAVRLQEEL